MRSRTARTSALLVTALLLTAVPAQGQGLKIAVRDVGLGIGPVPEITGLRLNIRDDYRFERVTGINVTLWGPEDDARSDVHGLAVGLPLTGAGTLQGIGVGVGVSATRDFSGAGFGLLGLGAGRDLKGVMIAGLGLGAGRDVQGIGVGLLGVGAGRNVEGIALGGLGVGAGGSGSGLAFGGLGAGFGGDFTGVALGGLGVGVGGDISGVTAAVGGIGAGGDITGLSVAGAGIGAGGHLKYVSLAGVGVAAVRITGLAAALSVAGADVRGVVVAPAYFRISDSEGRDPGSMRGVALSAYNDIRGSMSGVSIGLVNIAQELHGLQLGLINIARNARFPVLPLANFHP